MNTDRAPFDYHYLSGRLLTDLQDGDDAVRRPRRSGVLTVSLPFISLQLGRRGPRLDSLRGIAWRSIDMVSDYTSDLDDVAIYIRTRLPLQYGVFRALMGWPGGEVACYRGERTSAEGGRVVLALFGSARNVVGYRADAAGNGYYPSDLDGICALLDAVREHGDPPIDFSHAADELGLALEARVEMAERMARGGADRVLGDMDLLARPFFTADGIVVGDGPPARIVVGTPLWIATPRPVPHRGGPPPR